MKQVDDQHKDLSRIKEILFGEELQGLDARLEELRDELEGIINNQIKSLEEKLKEQKAFHEKQLEDVVQLLKEEKQDKKNIEKTWQETIRQMEISMNAHAAEYNEKLKVFSKQQQTQTTEILEALKKEFLDGINKLDETKVNKVEIAELFGLMIQKLK